MTFVKGVFVDFALFILFLELTSAFECGNIPSDGCSVTRDTIFIQGDYFLPHGIVINANEVSLDCNGSVLNGKHNFQNGITIYRRSDIIIKNCSVINYERANLFLKEADRVRIENNLFAGSEWNYGAQIYNSSKIILKNNKLEENRVGLYIEGFEKKNYEHFIDATNSVNSKSVIYLFNASDSVIKDLNLGHLEINYGENISIFNNSILGDGIKLNNVINSFVFANTIKNSYVGLDLQNSDKNKIMNNQISNNAMGTRIQKSNNNQIITNNILSSDYEGLFLFESNNNLIKNNGVIGSRYYNLRLTSSSDNIILNNNFSKAGDSGILIDGVKSERNNFSLNNLEQNAEFNLINKQEANILAVNNWWGSVNVSEIKKSIYDRKENKRSGTVYFRPFSRQSN